MLSLAIIARVEEAAVPTAQAVRLRVDDDLRRSRLTVLFRLPLALPHLLWLTLWSYVAPLALLVAWVGALVTGRVPEPLHRFLSAFVRYQTHVYAFLLLVGNPFPGFVGAAGSYPVDLELPPRERQSRWSAGFRIFLAIPAFLVAAAVVFAVEVAAFLGWFAALVTGRMPRGFRDLGAYGLRYYGETFAYFYLLTGRYPFSGPPA